MTRTNDGSLNLPFEGQDPAWLEDDFMLSGGVVVAGCIVPVPDAGNKPGLVFRFAKVDGTGFWPPILMVLEGDQVREVPRLVDQASKAAAKAVRASS